MAHAELGRSLLGDDIYDCKGCEEAPFRLEQLGHDREPTGLWDSNLITDAPLTRCPVRLLQLAEPEVRREILRWKDQYPDFKKGHLLVAGGISDQPARWIEAMHCLESLDQRQQSKYLEIKKASDGDSA